MVYRQRVQPARRVLQHRQSDDGRLQAALERCDMTHPYDLQHLLDEGLVQGPLFIQTVFGLMGGIGAHYDDVMHMERTADRLFGDRYQWSVLGAGKNQLPISASLGGYVRVGLEDSLWAGPSRLASSNAEQVVAVRQIIEGLGLEVATPDEACELLASKDAESVAF
ncbi:MAG: 3-keto-5-aminohexanoate cleavage protein [Paracoccus sp. (in: a-proteobacteria)]|uniref:3-keto-5-aminohexanoate cleavage protein n=1 Tax=Paracoccus sp. TaxID=267 RepID=UPI00405880B8